MIDGYVLSQEADYDIEAIFEYGEYRFGNSQAIEYLIGLNNHFIALAQNPDIGKARTEIKDGLFSFPYCAHTIFYRKLKGYVRIVRVLYGGRDLVKFLR
ncbi:type II toxin-antitoxin system RelE/ParE family toxin [Flagellimonas zhangzhouensis]|uniref:Toxin n=1 Tax=Flagellimonas zhangzhouensis TaxID=1073328 RepID=A0A1H2YN09_9FLAO|nr:type II toxin-antitoxin system RelE/ParE family toxin [Allomuricauda zhangzhouensis]SDR01266.1 toxin ParE1/3/4 [Allomuricauda zhangzhouensis]SDX06623.1 toxin ParE1/3/4 [Allomuricauda zhangzhouensis]